MSDEESDEEIFLGPEREKKIDEDVHSNLEVLNQKTVNLEDLLNELVRRGCLSFEEKFKILSGIKDAVKFKSRLSSFLKWSFMNFFLKHIDIVE